MSSGSLYGFVRRRGPVSPEEVARSFLGVAESNGGARSLVESVASPDSRLHWDEQGFLAARELADLGLSEAPYVVVDLETTGSSAKEGGITEIGAVRVEGGRLTETFSTLVNPLRPIQPYVVGLTGITDEMVAGAPLAREVLPRLGAFCEGAVLVGHNVSFDISFLKAAGAIIDAPVLDTLRLARVLAPGLRRYKLSALARHFDIPTEPNHRALDDARATAGVLLELVELAQECGVGSVGEAAALRKGGVKPPAKRHLADALPRKTGVYYFLGRRGEALYVGKARDLRSRVRSYFSGGDGRRKIPRLISEVSEIRFEETASELSALVLEAREIRRLSPPYNTAGRTDRPRWYLHLDLRQQYPVPCRSPEPSPEDGVLSFGPYHSATMLDSAMETLGHLFAFRRCEEGRGPCFYGQIGRCGPCSGMNARQYREQVVDRLAALLRGEDAGLLAELATERDRLAGRLEFERAARMRDLLHSIERLRLAGALEEMRGPRLLVCASADEDLVELFALRDGRLLAHERFSSAKKTGVRRFLEGVDWERHPGSTFREASLIAAYLRRRSRAVEEVEIGDERALIAAMERIVEGGA